MAKLMLVEDDNNLREIYEARLQAEGYKIVTAKDGEEALVVAKAEKPDLIISDVMMPKISGFEMLDILHNTEGLKDVKVIMLTALGQADDQQRADKLGADRYLVKSQVTLEDIVKVAHELLEGDGALAAPPGVAPAPEAPTPAPQAASVPEPVPEPVAAEPVAEPAAEATAPEPAPEPEAASEPVASVPEPPAVEAAVEGDQQSAAQEEASAKAKIEDFVAGATEEATPPPAASPAETAAATEADQDKIEPEPLAPEVTTPETPAPAGSDPGPATSADAVAVDDQLVNDATKALSDAAADDKAKNASTAVEAPKPATAESTEEDQPGSVPIAHKKVIHPIEGEPKKDINQLLAEEEAKEAGQAPGAEAKPVVGDASQDNQDKKDKIDPNSIAL